MTFSKIAFWFLRSPGGLPSKCKPDLKWVSFDTWGLSHPLHSLNPLPWGGSNLFCDLFIYFLSSAKRTRWSCFWKFPKAQNIFYYLLTTTRGLDQLLQNRSTNAGCLQRGHRIAGVVGTWENNPSIEKSYFAPGCDSRVNSEKAGLRWL